VDVETCRRWLADAGERTWLPLDASASAGSDDSVLHETIADPAAIPADGALIEQETLEGLKEAFQELGERDRLVLSLSFYEELSLRQIGAMLHITESRVSQIRTRALQRLREVLRAQEAA
jgi:RNA polymerase sigma factor for flagellar operon FliA